MNPYLRDIEDHQRDRSSCHHTCSKILIVFQSVPALSAFHYHSNRVWLISVRAVVQNKSCKSSKNRQVKSRVPAVIVSNVGSVFLRGLPGSGS